MRDTPLSSEPAARQRGGWIGGFVLGVVAALLALPAAGYLYLRYGHPPVAAADPSFPYEAQIVHIPLNARIERELKTAPFTANQATFEAGARIYASQCAACHGTPGHEAAYGKTMFPAAPQLWKQHRNSQVVGVSDDEAGETFWKIENGIRLAGMPAYQRLLSDTEMWQVTLLLKNADQPLPPTVLAGLGAGAIGAAEGVK